MGEELFLTWFISAVKKVRMCVKNVSRSFLARVSLVFPSNLLRLRIYECPVAILALVRAVNNESCLDLCNKTNKSTCIQYVLSHTINP